MVQNDYTQGLFKVVSYTVDRVATSGDADMFTYTTGGIEVGKIGEKVVGKVEMIGTHKQCWDWCSDNFDFYRD